MSDNVLNPLSGVESGETTSLTVRRQSGSDVSVTWNEDENRFEVDNGAFIGGTLETQQTNFRELRAADSGNNTFFDASLNVPDFEQAPTVSTTGNVGSGTTIVYRIVSLDSNDNATLPSPEVTVDADPNSLDSNNFITLDWNDIPEADRFAVYKDVGNTGSWEVPFENVLSPVLTDSTYDDTGASTVSDSLPTENQTGSFAFGGSGDVVGISSSAFISYDKGNRGQYFLKDNGVITTEADSGIRKEPDETGNVGSFGGAFTIGAREINDRSQDIGIGSIVLGGNSGFRESKADADYSLAAGLENISSAYAQTSTGSFNKESVSAAANLSEVTDDNRIFSIGVGDNPNDSPGDGFYVDGRGRTDGLYVTYRDGTFIRDGLTALDNKDNTFFESSLTVQSVYDAPSLNLNGSPGSGTDVDYAVVARDAEGNRTLLSPTSTVNIDPTSLDGSNFVTVDWQAASGNVSDYVVVKDEGQTGFVQIGSPVAAGTTTFDDTGQSTSSFTVPSQNETAVTSLGVNNTADTSGDLQIRDDSSGDLFSLNDGNTPQLATRYEGNGAFTLGYRNRDDGIGDNSLVLGGEQGNSNLAAFSNSIAVGKANRLGLPGIFDAKNSIGIGTRNDIFNDYAISIGGHDNTSEKQNVEGLYSIALGFNSSAEGDENYSLGFDNIASSVGKALAVGSSNSSTGQRSVSIGFNNSASGDNSLSFGFDNSTSELNSILFGINNSVSNDDIAIGEGLNLANIAGNSVVGLGKYNEDISTRNVKFVIGVGDSDSNRKNAFVIENLGGNLYSKTEALSVNDASINNGGTVSNAIYFGNSTSVPSSNTATLNNSFIQQSTIDSDNTHSGNYIQNSDITDYGSFITGSYLTNASLQSGSSILKSLILSTNIDSNNSNEFKTRSDGSVIEVFAYGQKTIVAYEQSSDNNTSTPNRDGSVVLAGGSINNVPNSVAIGGATVSSSSTVGIGTNTFINTSNTSAFDVQDGSGNSIFNVDTTTGDVEVNQDGQGVILTSPDGTEKKRVFLDNSGNLATQTV